MPKHKMSYMQMRNRLDELEAFERAEETQRLANERRGRELMRKENLLSALDAEIAAHRHQTVTPDAVAKVALCVQLRALLLAPEVGPA